MDIAIRLNNDVLESACLNNIGIIYKEMGDYEKSLLNLEKAYLIDKNLGDPINIAIDLINLGETLRHKGLASSSTEDLNKALVYFDECLKLARNNAYPDIEVKVLNNIGTVESDLRHYSVALDKFREAHAKAGEIQDIETMGMALNNMGIVFYNLGNYEKSSQYYGEAIVLAERIRGGHILWEAYLRKANTLKKQNNIPMAIENYKKSIETIEGIRAQITLEEFKASFLGSDKRIEAYHNLIDLYIGLDKNSAKKQYRNEAFLFLEKAKARAFLDSMETSRVDPSQGPDILLRNREKELLKDIAGIHTQLLDSASSRENADRLQSELADLENKLEALKREMRTKNPAYANLKYPEIISLESARKQLPDARSAFIEYLVGQEFSYAFVITRSDIRVFPIPPKDKLKPLVLDHLKSISDKDSTGFDTGAALFNTLVKPGLDGKIKRIIFVPDGILHYLPFETLICDTPGRPWLIEKYTVSYSPSITALREIISRRKTMRRPPKKDFLAFGDPRFSGRMEGPDENSLLLRYFPGTEQNIQELKYSAEEINGIASLFPDRKKKIFLGALCTEENFKDQKLDDYRIIHFATHSLIDDSSPERSTIILSLDDDPKEDGFLQVREIYNLKMKSDLITLSACRSGLGRLVRGEGIEGLNRAFFYAGTSAVLMSLWAVNDQATSQLMERFYTHLHSSESTANALRHAKLEFINSSNLSHPYYWAGFIVSGNGDIRIFNRSYKKWIIGVIIFIVIGFVVVIGIKKKEIQQYFRKKLINQ